MLDDIRYIIPFVNFFLILLLLVIILRHIKK